MGQTVRVDTQVEPQEEADALKVSEMKPKTGPAFQGTRLLVWTIRSLIVVTTVLCIRQRDIIQVYINLSWHYLRSSWVFNSVYFETWWATFCYAWMIPVYPFALHFMKCFDKYKISPSVTYVHQTLLDLLKEAVFYMSPLMLLDTFIVKKYSGVDPSVWVEKRQTWIQSTRALPEQPPTFYQLVFQLVASILLYDALFFAVHLVLHKNLWLYKKIHAHHHNHDVMHAHVTNQLTVVERITLILSANFALKVFNSHPLTRLLFVPVFIFLLVDNHSGYDLPFGLHRILPFGIMGGPVKHFKHHLHGARNYQPFLTYLDDLLEKKKQL